jgi:hypothetical protein
MRPDWPRVFPMAMFFPQPACVAAGTGILRIDGSGVALCAGQGGAESSMPYAVVGGAHLLVGLKSTDLQWRGPPDRNISYSIRGSGADGLHIHGIWTASGVRMEKTFKTANLTFWGRQFEEFTVTSDNGACDVTLVIKEGDEMVFSGPLKGKGVLQYRGKQARPTEDDGGRP